LAQNAIDPRLKHVADNRFHRSVRNRTGADFVQNGHRDPAYAGDGRPVDGIGRLEIQAARDLRPNDTGRIAGVDEHPERPRAIEEDLIEDQGMAGDGGVERFLSGGRKGREDDNEARKSHVRSLRLACGDGLDGMVICLPRWRKRPMWDC